MKSNERYANGFHNKRISIKHFDGHRKGSETERFLDYANNSSIIQESYIIYVSYLSTSENDLLKKKDMYNIDVDRSDTSRTIKFGVYWTREP